jgi:hypothetical protein
MITHMDAAFACPDLAALERLVLLSLARHADDAGVCWPSVARLARMTGLSARRVQYALRDLEKRGMIRVTGRSGPRSGNRYLLTLDRPRAATDPCTSCTPQQPDPCTSCTPQQPDPCTSCTTTPARLAPEGTLEGKEVVGDARARARRRRNPRRRRLPRCTPGGSSSLRPWGTRHPASPPLGEGGPIRPR